MQTTHERKILNIIDLDSQGKPVKENQIELLFAGSYQNIETKIKSGLLTPLNNPKRSEENSSNSDEDDKAPSLVGPPFYSGSIPTQYSVFQLMPQWTPQLNRIILNYPNEINSICDWSSFHVKQLMTEAGRLKLNGKIRSAFGERAKLMIYKGLPDGKVKKFNLSLEQRGLESNPRFMKDDELFKKIYPDNNSYPGYERKAHSFIDDLCVRDQPGLFQIVSQTSPAGGMNYEDLSILDPSDPNQWLVVVFVPGDTHDTVYRQLFHSKN